MTEHFLAIPPEKRERVFAAAIEVFARHEYRHASTDDIAAKAGVSKGILFYWFRNKQEMYPDCLQYLGGLTQRAFEEVQFENVTDFFELMELGGQVKTEIVRRAPYYTDFALRAYFSDEEWIVSAVQALTGQSETSVLNGWFENVDWSKFRDGVDGTHVLQMLIWMMTGYIQDRRQKGGLPDMDEIMAEYRRWAEIFRAYAYKEEYQ